MCLLVVHLTLHWCSLVLFGGASLQFATIIPWCYILTKKCLLATHYYCSMVHRCCSLTLLLLLLNISLPIVCFCCSPTPHYSFWLFPNTSLLLFTFVTIVHFHYYTSTQHATHKINYILTYCSLPMFHFYSLLLFTFGFIPLQFGTSSFLYKCGKRSLKFWFFQIKTSSSSFQIQISSR